MSDDKLSQNDIDALIAKVRGTSAPAKPANNSLEELNLSDIEKKGLSKLFRISIEASSEVLKSITQRDVTVESISDFKVAGGKEISELIGPPFIATQIQYTIGLKGLDLLLIKKEDLNNLMTLQFESMGISPLPDDEEFILSSSSEVMNQMLGNVANKVGNALDIFVDISTPSSTIINEGDVPIPGLKEDSSSYIYTTFRLNIAGEISGDLIKVIDYSFLEELKSIMHKGNYLDELYDSTDNKEEDKVNQPSIPEPEIIIEENTAVQNNNYTQNNSYIQDNNNLYQEETVSYAGSPSQKSSNIIDGENVTVSKYELPKLDFNPNLEQKMAPTSRIKSVEVELTVELGRTKMKVKDILELDKGSIVELSTLAGEHVNLYANGTLISKGEIVVIKDNFAFRVLNIVDQDYR